MGSMLNMVGVLVTPEIKASGQIFQYYLKGPQNLSLNFTDVGGSDHTFFNGL
jgi:hypothetical protein